MFTSGKSMNLNRILPVLTNCARTSGSVSSANFSQPGHSKSPNSTTSIGAVGLPMTYPSDVTGGRVGSITIGGGPFLFPTTYDRRGIPVKGTGGVHAVHPPLQL